MSLVCTVCGHPQVWDPVTCAHCGATRAPSTRPPAEPGLTEAVGSALGGLARLVFGVVWAVVCFAGAVVVIGVALRLVLSVAGR